jgi:hypothetical protein
VTQPDPRDPFTRFHAGFDRWSRNSIADREITCRLSGEHLHAANHHGDVWFWDDAQNVWWKLTEAHQSDALRDNASLLEKLRSAIPVIRLYVGTSVAGEQEAARQALGRIGNTIWAIWEQYDPIVEGVSLARWLVKPSEIMLK